MHSEQQIVQRIQAAAGNGGAKVTIVGVGQVGMACAFRFSPHLLKRAIIFRFLFIVDKFIEIVYLLLCL